jgi:hypothetical protein
MKANITDAIADLVLQSEPDLTTRLEYQAEALREAKCTNPVIGKWIDANDVKYLLSTFALEGEDFAARFPAMAHITSQERQRVIAAIENHCDRCPHCSLKRGYDLELDARIKHAGQQNNSVLLQLLEEEGTDLSEEDEPQGATLEAARSAHQ